MHGDPDRFDHFTTGGESPTERRIRQLEERIQRLENRNKRLGPGSYNPSPYDLNYSPRIKKKATR